jgi:hypothetical protein
LSFRVCVQEVAFQRRQQQQQEERQQKAARSPMELLAQAESAMASFGAVDDDDGGGGGGGDGDGDDDSDGDEPGEVPQHKLLRRRPDASHQQQANVKSPPRRR